MSVIKSISVFIILMELHMTLCQFPNEESPPPLTIVKAPVPIEIPQCDCSNAQNGKEVVYSATYDNCPRTQDCEPTITKVEINRRRSLDHKNSNINVNSNTNAILARRFLDDDENGNININTNGDDADLDAAILLKNLGFIFPRSGLRRHPNLKRRYYGSHSTTSNHGRRHRNVIVQTNGHNVGVFGDSNVNDDNVVYVVNDDAAVSQESDPGIVVASRRSPNHPHSHSHQHY